MKFAINYSPLAAELVLAGQIEVDLFKCPDWPDILVKATAVRPSYVHFPLRAGGGSIDRKQLDCIAEFLDDSDTPYVNMHLSPNASDFDSMPVDTKHPIHREKLVEAILNDVATVVDRFGQERVILENLMWAPTRPYRIPLPVLEPETISRIVRRTGCGLILDLAHASISAKRIGMDEREYVSALPTERLCELHVAGTMQQDDGLWEDHYEMSNEDWLLTEWAIACVVEGRWEHPWIMTFEYGGVGASWNRPTEKRTMLQQVPKLSYLACLCRSDPT